MRALVVEDEPDSSDFLARGLREDGYAVDVAEDGEEALACVATAEFDVIILDIPAPFGPSRPTISPAPISNETPFTATTSPSRSTMS